MPAVVKIEPESQREHFDYSNRSEKVSIEEDEFAIGSFVIQRSGHRRRENGEPFGSLAFLCHAWSSRPPMSPAAFESANVSHLSASPTIVLPRQVRRRFLPLDA